MFHLALLPTVLDLNQVDRGQWVKLVLVTIFVLIATLAPYAVLASRERGLMTRTGTLTRLNRAAAGIIGATGLLIIGQAMNTLARRA